MKITRLETHLLTADWTGTDPYWDGGTHKSTALVRVITDDGLTGIGESLLGYFLPEAVPTFVDYFAPLLIGEDPRDTEALWERMYKSSFYWGRKGAGLAVLSAIDLALWDIKAQAADVPLYRLLGGLARDRILVYASGGGSMPTLDKTVQKVQTYAGLGYCAAKIAIASGTHRTYDDRMGNTYGRVPTSQLADLAGEKFRVLREAMGPEFELMTQSAGMVPFSLREAVRMAEAIAPYGLLFYEEPMVYENLSGFVNLRNVTRVAIAGGESLSGLNEFESLLAAGAVDIVQPDVTYCGGITAALRIIAVARAHHARVAFHLGGSFGPGFAASLHLSLATKDAVILERVPATAQVQADLCAWPLELVDGRFAAPPVNGLGVELTDEHLRRYRFVPGTGERN